MQEHGVVMLVRVRGHQLRHYRQRTMTKLAGTAMTILSVKGKTKVWRYTHYLVDMKQWSQADLKANLPPPSDHPDWSGRQTHSFAGAQRGWRNRPRTWLRPTFPPTLRHDVCLPVIWWTNTDCVRLRWTHWVTGQAWRRSGLPVCLIRLRDHKTLRQLIIWLKHT